MPDRVGRGFLEAAKALLVITEASLGPDYPDVVRMRQVMEKLAAKDRRRQEEAKQLMDLVPELQEFDGSGRGEVVNISDKIDKVHVEPDHEIWRQIDQILAKQIKEQKVA